MKLLLVSRSGAACPAPSLMELQGPLSARPHRHGWVQSGRKPSGWDQGKYRLPNTGPVGCLLFHEAGFLNLQTANSA